MSPYNSWHYHFTLLKYSLCLIYHRNDVNMRRGITLKGTNDGLINDRFYSKNRELNNLSANTGQLKRSSLAPWRQDMNLKIRLIVRAGSQSQCTHCTLNIHGNLEGTQTIGLSFMKNKMHLEALRVPFIETRKRHCRNEGKYECISVCFLFLCKLKSTW